MNINRKASSNSLYAIGSIGLAMVSVFLAFVFIPSKGVLHEVEEVAAATYIDQPTIKPVFSDQTISSGLIFTHTQRSGKLANIAETLGAGVCILDFDQDGKEDVFVVGGLGQTRKFEKRSWWESGGGHGLFKNITRKKDRISFVDVSNKILLSEPTWGMGCAVGDFNNDGYPDIFVTNRRANTLFQNIEGRSFEVVTNVVALNNNSWSTSAALNDINNDGLLDIVVANYIDFQKTYRTLEATRGFKPLVEDSFRPEMFKGVPNQVLLNKGNFRFEDVSKEYGLDNIGRTLSLQWVNIDNSHHQALYVANDKDSTTHIYKYNGKSYAQSVDSFFGETSAGINGVTYFARDSKTLLATSVNGGVQQQLFIIGENGVFSDIAWESAYSNAGSLNQSGWGITSADLNLDGIPDLIVNQGSILPDPDSPYLPLGQPPQILLGQIKQGPYLQFIDFPLNFPNDATWHSGRGVVTADFDKDGDADIVLSSNNGPVSLWVNKTSDAVYENWIAFEFIDESGNADFFGGEAVLSTNINQYKKFGDSQQSFLSTGSKKMFFNLQNAEVAEKLDIVWKNGRKFSIKITQEMLGKVHRVSSVSTLTNVELLNDSELPDVSRYNTGVMAEYFYWKINDLNKNKENRSEFETRLLNSVVSGLVNELPNKIKLSIYQRLLENDDSSPGYQLFAYELLNQGNQSQALVAIEWLKKAEINRSVYWLMNTLASLIESEGDVDISCAITKTLKHFYREEEAVPFHKYLAIPELIYHLDSAGSEVKVCILDALAEGERYRAIEPIASLINDTNIRVRLAAINGLGRLQHHSAIKPLVGFSNNSNLSTSEKLELLIAFKRLDKELYNKYLQTWLLHDDNTIMQRVLGFNSSLMVHVDKALIQSDIDAQAEALINYRMGSLYKNQKEIDAYIKYALVSENANILESLINSIPKLKKALAKLLSDSTQRLSQAMQDKLLAKNIFVERVITRMENEGRVLSSVQLRKLLANSKLKADVVSLLHPSQGMAAVEILRKALRVENNTNASVFSSRVCERFPNAKLEIKIADIKDLKNEHWLNAIRCIVSQNAYGLNKTELTTYLDHSIPHQSAKTANIALAELARLKRGWVPSYIAGHLLRLQYNDQTSIILKSLNDTYPNYLSSHLKKNIMSYSAEIKSHLLARIIELNLNIDKELTKILIENSEINKQLRAKAAGFIGKTDSSYAEVWFNNELPSISNALNVIQTKNKLEP